ncbi:MAG: PD-(D/E)XK motif protein [Coriobacteriia bacterium]|nr:PD-(D/E)XK motif protein [Coriobacteriia bacterium]
MTIRSFPWDDLIRPDSVESYSSRLINVDSRWDIFWIVDLFGNVGILIECDYEHGKKYKPPSLKELETRIAHNSEVGTTITFLLKEANYTEVFFEFCIGLIQSLEEVSNSGEVERRAVSYLWNWYRFLRGESDGALSNELQRGLIAELVFLKDVLSVSLGWSHAINFWTGPFGNPKDFAWGKHAVEVKSHLNDARPVIKISSEYQLDNRDIELLWLFVLGFQRGKPGSEGAMTLTELVLDISDSLEDSHPELIENFYEHLFAYGFSFEQDYQDYHWTWSKPRIFEVAEAFPKIEASRLPQGITKVNYNLSLRACEPFEYDVSILEGMINVK